MSLRVVSYAVPTVTYAATFSAVFTIPSSAQTTDVLAVGWVEAGSSPTFPPGWTSVTAAGTNTAAGTGNFSGTFGVQWKAVALADPGSTVTVTGNGSSLDDAFVGILVVLRAVNQSSPVDVGANLATNNQSTVTSPSLTTTANNELVFEFWSGLFNPQSTSQSITAPSGTTTVTSASSSNPGASSAAVMLCDYTGAATAGAQAGHTATFSAAFTTYPEEVSRVAFAYMSAPLAPTLSSPANGVYQDLSGTPTFTWTHNPSPGNGSQNAYSFRRKISGAGSYSYWNASTSVWQSTIVWNPSTVSSLTFPAAAWTDGSIYNWSVATQESVDSLQGPFASDFTVTAQTPPVVTVTGPTGTQANFTPAVTWTDTLASGAVQTSYRVVVYSAAQYTAGGFVAGSGSNAADSGVVSTAALSWPIPAGSLSNNTTYRAYVQVTETGNETSTWSYSAFTVSVDTPAPPIITATAGTDPTTGAPTVALAVQGTGNLLSVDDSSFEGSIGTWTCANATLAQDATYSVDGSYSLLVTASAAATIVPVTAKYSVVPGLAHSGMVSILAQTTARQVTAQIAWYDNTNTLISTTSGTAATETVGSFVQATVTGTAPANAVTGALQVSIASAASGEKHNLDKTGIRLGADTTWYRGGLVGTCAAEVQSSDDGGVTWVDVRGGSALTLPSSNQQVALTDYELIPGTQRLYRAQASVVVSGATLISPWSTTVNATITVTSWWLTVPGTPSLARSIDVTADTTTTYERAASHYGLGAQYPTVFADVVGGVDGQIVVQTHDADTYTALLTIVRGQQVVWLMSPMAGTGSISGRYVRLGIPPGQDGGGHNSAHAGELVMSPAAKPIRISTFTYVQMARP